MTTQPPAGLDLARRLVPSQAMYVFGMSVDLTLTGIVGDRLAPSRLLATLPFALIPFAAGVSTFVLSRWIGRAGYRRVFTSAAAVAVVAGLLSALAVQTDRFWLFCVGTALVGVYQAGAGYYRYAAADAAPDARARAVSTVLAGGLVAALLGPFAATAVRTATSTPYVASYLLVAGFALLAVGWNAGLPRALTLAGRVAAAGRVAPAARAGDGHRGPGGSVVPTGPVVPGPRSRRTLWRQPDLLAGVAAVVLAAVAMTSMMTAGPIAGMDMGHSEGQAAFAVQLHMVGMFAPGFVVARWIGRFGERRVAVAGAVVVVLAGLSAAVSPSLPTFLAAMLLVGVGWNLAYSGGSALVAASYRPGERGLVQPYAEAAGTVFQVAGTLSAGALATRAGWPTLGLAVVVAAAAVAVLLARGPRSRPLVPEPASPEPAVQAGSVVAVPVPDRTTGPSAQEP